MTVKDIYDRTKDLTNGERVELVTLLLDDVTPEPPHSFSDRKGFADLVQEGLNSGTARAIDDDYWTGLDERIRTRAGIQP